MTDAQRKNNVVFGRFNNQQAIATTAETVESTSADPLQAWFDELIAAIRTNTNILQNSTAETAKPLQSEIRALQLEANALTEKLNNAENQNALLEDISAFAKKVHTWSVAVAALEPETGSSLALANVDSQTPKPNRLPLYLGLGIGAAALVGAFVYMTKKDTSGPAASFTKSKPKKIKLKRVGALKAR